MAAAPPAVAASAGAVLTRGGPRSAPSVFSRLAPAKATVVFDSYWRFAARRQQVYVRRLAGEAAPWTTDPIINSYRFTNAYRAADRVSQYLIKHVIYGGSFSEEDTFFRVLLFKLFNRIDTWELIRDRLDEPSWRGFNFDRYADVLSKARSQGQRIYSAAYIMPPGSFGHREKHRNHLELLCEMMRRGAPRQIAAARSLKEVFEILIGFPTIGPFLGYQLAIDLNYSRLIDFEESEFVVPGPGALDGIRKCFSDLGGLSEADIIRLVTERQDQEFERLGLSFYDLWGRPLQLIDCQNLFCEVDKYARLLHPEVAGRSGRTKIKQRFRTAGPLAVPFFPPKWKIHQGLDILA